MKKCLFIINKSCGNFEKFDKDSVETVLGGEYSVEFADIDDDYHSRILEEGFNAVAILGGDGTLNSVLNKIKGLDVKVFYLPYGTLNEKSHTLDGVGDSGDIMVGSVNGRLFTYVAACGTFTPIGYKADVKQKKRLKAFAYFLEALKECHVYNIGANIDIDGEKHDGRYTLIMVLKSPRCFKFRFNHLYDPNTTTGHILLVKSPGKSNLWNLIRIFFPFFRAFFVGFRKEYSSKNMLFKEFNQVSLQLEESTAFDIDGEMKMLEGNNVFKVNKLQHKFIVCDTRRAKRLAKKQERKFDK